MPALPYVRRHLCASVRLRKSESARTRVSISLLGFPRDELGTRKGSALWGCAVLGSALRPPLGLVTRRGGPLKVKRIERVRNDVLGFSRIPHWPLRFGWRTWVWSSTRAVGGRAAPAACCGVGRTLGGGSRAWRVHLEGASAHGQDSHHFSRAGAEGRSCVAFSSHTMFSFGSTSCSYKNFRAFRYKVLS